MYDSGTIQALEEQFTEAEEHSTKEFKFAKDEQPHIHIQPVPSQQNHYEAAMDPAAAKVCNASSHQAILELTSRSLLNLHYTVNRFMHQMWISGINLILKP